MDEADRLKELESERFSTAYLKHSPASRRLAEQNAEAKATAKRSQDNRALRRVAELYFHAGRYAAGARDDRAIKAHKQVTNDTAKETAK